MSSASIPYAGSKISLISKSDIRYVGTLHSINQQDSTVSLEQGNLNRMSTFVLVFELMHIIVKIINDKKEK